MQSKKTELNYIGILKDSLLKKLNILENISKINLEQGKIIKENKFDFEKFDMTIQEKNILIEELKALDNGFQKVYDRVKNVLMEDKESYRDQINEMKILVKKVMDRSIDVETEELRNKESFSKRTEILKKEVKIAKASNKVATDYYKNMNKTSVVESQFLDWKN